MATGGPYVYLLFMIAGLITIWVFIASAYYVSRAVWNVVPYVPKILAVLICLPAIPFVVAYKNRERHPGQARFIFAGWSLLYLLLAFILYMES